MQHKFYSLYVQVDSVYTSVPLLRYWLKHGFGYNTARSWPPNGHFLTVSLYNYPFITRFTYNTVQFYGSHT